MFDAYLKPIAAAYAGAIDDRAASSGPRSMLAWSELARDSEQRAEGIRLLLAVNETDDPEPYSDAVAMCEDIHRGRFFVSRANSEHPIWTVEQNVAFRIVHDVLGHYAASMVSFGDLGYGYPNGDPADVAGFDWEGENRACAKHARLLAEGRGGPRMALFTECIAQTAYAIDRDGFGPQRIADLTEWPLQIMVERDEMEARAANSQWFNM